MKDEKKESGSKLHISESEQSLNPKEKKTNLLRTIYLILTIMKTCFGLYILYENKRVISTLTDKLKIYMFQLIMLYTFLWPIASVFSTLFFVRIHIIDLLLQITNPRKDIIDEISEKLNTKSLSFTKSFNNLSNYKFFLTHCFFVCICNSCFCNYIS